MLLVIFLPASIASSCYGDISLLDFLLVYLLLAALIVCTISIGMLVSCFIANTRNASAAALVFSILLAFILWGFWHKLLFLMQMIIAPDTIAHFDTAFVSSEDIVPSPKKLLTPHYYLLCVSLSLCLCV